jgi:hypothetical protein
MEPPIRKLNFYLLAFALLVACASSFLSACKTLIPTPKATLTFTPSPSASPTPIPTSTSTATAQPPVAVLLASPQADQNWVNTLQTALNSIVVGAGLRWQVRQQLSQADLRPELRLVVAVPPDPGIGELLAAAPDTQFLALGIQGLQPAQNLTILDESRRMDQEGFVAGFIAAMLSDDWRVGVISVSDTVEGKSARTGFLNGVVYFCGLCRPAHPPFYEYPLYIELPAAATSPEWQEAANYMVDHFAQTVYVYPGAGDENMLSILASAKINIISSGEPTQADKEAWIVSLTMDPLPLIQNEVSGLLDGSVQGGQLLTVPIQFTQINPTVFTPGKQRFAQQVLDDLQAGFIDTGVDLTTGELRP